MSKKLMFIAVPGVAAVLVCFLIGGTTFLPAGRAAETATVLRAPSTTTTAVPTPPPRLSSPPSRPVALTVSDHVLSPAPTDTERRRLVGTLYGQCIHDATALNPADMASSVRTDGPTVGVIGDSLTTQIRDRFTADQQRRWLMWSRCGADTRNLDQTPAVANVLAAHPKTLVVAVGTNDANFEAPTVGFSDGFDQRAAAILDRAVTAGVACVVWVNVSDTPDHGPVYSAEAVKVNDQITRLSTRPDVRVITVDWNAAVHTDPHLLYDGIHLTPAGQQVRWDAINAATTECAS